MKVILEFNLPEDRDEHTLVVNAQNMYSVLWDIDQKMRSISKYNSENQSEEVIDAIDKLREDFWDIMTDNNISFDMVE